MSLGHRVSRGRHPEIVFPLMSDAVDSRPVVCHLVEDLRLGGVEELLRLIVTGLNSQKYRVIVCAIEEGGVTADRIRTAGIPLTILGYKTYHRLHPLKELARFLRDQRVTILHTHMYFANMAGRWANLFAHVPVIITTVYSTYHERRLRHRLMEWWWAHWTDRIIAAAEVIRDYASRQARIPREKFVVIHDAARDLLASAQAEGLDRAKARAVLGLRETDYVIGCVARLDPVKGHEYLLAAMPRVLAAHPETILLIVGDGPRRVALEAQARDLGIEQRVRFLGARQDIASIVLALDLFVLASSLREGCPLAVLEAMSMAQPVVASRLGGLVEEVDHGVSGLLVPPRDPAALAEAIRTLQDDPGFARRMGDMGRKRYERQFTPAVMLGKIESLYDELLQAKGL
jgi:glycosyltransferase involved in cell wall biosynthesis